MADLALNVTLSARNKSRKEIKRSLDHYKGIDRLTTKIAAGSKLIEKSWRNIPRQAQRATTAATRHTRQTKVQTKEITRQVRGAKKLTLEQAKQSEQTRRHNRQIRNQAKDALGVKRMGGPGFDPDAPATNLRMAGDAADRFARAGRRGLESITTAGLNFGTAVREVTTLTDNISSKQITDITKAAAEEFGALPAEQAKAFYQIVSAGTTDATKATELLTASNKLAVAGVTSVEGGFDAINAIMKPYAKSNITAAEASDQLFAAVRVGKTTLPALAANLAKITPLAAEAGVSSADVLAAVATITAETGANTEMASTQIAGLMANMIKTGPQAEKVFKRLGLRSDDTGKKFKNAKEAISELGTKGFLDAVKGAKRFNDKTLPSLLGNVRGLRAGLALSGAAGDKFADNLAAIENSTGAADTAFAKFADDPALRLKKANAQLETFKIALAEGVVPALAAAAETVGPMLKGMSAFAAKHPTLVTALGGIAVGTVGLASVASPVLGALSGVAGLTGGRGFGFAAGQRNLGPAGGAAGALAGGGGRGRVGRAAGVLGGAAAGLGLGVALSEFVLEVSGANDDLRAVRARNASLEDDLNARGLGKGQGGQVSDLDAFLSQEEKTRLGVLGITQRLEQKAIARGDLTPKQISDSTAEIEKAKAESLSLERTARARGAATREAVQAGDPRARAAAAANAVGLTIKVDQSGRVVGADLTSGTNVDLEMDVGEGG